jgi:glycosyltransferase involved in cell wall biosynthesis
VVTVYPRLSETFIAREIAGLERLGVPISVFSQKRLDPGAMPVPVTTRAPHRVLDGGGVSFLATLWDHITLFASRPRRYLALLRYAMDRGNQAARKKFWRAGRLARECERRGIAHLHAHFLSSNTRVARMAAELAGLTYSLTAHAKDIYAAGLSESKIRRRIDAASFAVTVSEHNRAHLGQAAGGARIVVIRNGVEVRRIPFRDSPPARPEVVLAVGRLVPKKGFDVLIEAVDYLARQSRPIEAWIVGQGPEEGALRQLIAARQLAAQVRLLGPRSPADVLALMAKAGLLAAPCVIAPDGDRDGLPTVIPEAMATGLPVVATRTVGIPEIVLDGETGLLAVPGDARDLARAIAELQADPERAARMARAARAKVEEEYDLDRNLSRLRDHFAAVARIRR